MSSLPLNSWLADSRKIESYWFSQHKICIPAQQKLSADWYRGTADAVRQNLNLVRRKDVEHILILSGDHIYKMNYLQLVAYHGVKKAGLTISAVRTRKEQAAGRLGVLEIDQDHRLIGFEEKPAQMKTLLTHALNRKVHQACVRARLSLTQ